MKDRPPNDDFIPAVYDAWNAIWEGPPIDIDDAHPFVKAAAGIMFRYLGAMSEGQSVSVPVYEEPEPVSGEIVNDTVLDP